MRYRVIILNPDESPVEAGELWFVEPHDIEDPKIRVPIENGEAKFEAEPVPIWGLFVDHNPVLALPVATEAEDVDLGEVVIVPKGVTLGVFHALNGKVFGLPRSLLELGKAVEDPLTKPGMSFGDALGSTAKQLSEAFSFEDKFALTGANVRLKGLPTSSDTSIGLDFPSAELAKTALSLSELSFSLRPKPLVPLNAPPPPPQGTQLLDVAGYSRELALRKLATAGYLTEVVGEVVDVPEDVGRVVRQLPPAGTLLPKGSLVRVFIGKGQGES